MLFTYISLGKTSDLEVSLSPTRKGMLAKLQDFLSSYDPTPFFFPKHLLVCLKHPLPTPPAEREDR